MSCAGDASKIALSIGLVPGLLARGYTRSARAAASRWEARLEKVLDKAHAEFDDPADFEGAGGPISQPWKSRPRKKAAKTKPAG